MYELYLSTFNDIGSREYIAFTYVGAYDGLSEARDAVKAQPLPDDEYSYLLIDQNSGAVHDVSNYEGPFAANGWYLRVYENLNHFVSSALTYGLDEDALAKHGPTETAHELVLSP